MRRSSALLIVALAGCATAEQNGPPPPLQIQVDSQKAEVTTQTLTEATVTVDAAATAPGAGITATGAHWELVFDGKVIAHGDQTLNTPISAGPEPTVLQLVGKSAVAADGKEVSALAAHHGGFPIALRGTIDFTGPNGATGKSDFAKATFLREPRMPSVVMIDVGASHYDDGHVNLTFNLGLDNPNPFPVDVAGFTYTITVNGQKVADTSMGNQVQVPPSSKKVIEVSEQLDPATFKDLERLYKMNSMNYHLTGLLDVGLAKFDVDMSSPINFTH